MRVTVTAILAAMVSFSAAHAQEKQASANMVNAEGKEVGTVTFTEMPSDMLHVMVEMTDLPPGPHGFHVHTTGACDPEGGFKSAGGHYAGDHEHGIHSAEGPHPGDLPNVHVGQDGILKVEFFSDDLSLSENGDNPLMDEDGSAVVLHASPDDYRSQPAGDAGERIACGVVKTY